MKFNEFIKYFPTLETDQILLRQISTNDAEEFYNYYSNDNVTRYLDWNGPNSLTHAKEIISEWNEGFTEGWIIRWAIILKAENKIIGTNFLSEFEECIRAEIGYELSEDYWKQGIMTEALNEIISFGFNKIYLNRIQATIEPDNLPSETLIRKCHFNKEGLLKGYGFNETNNQYVDLNLYAPLKNDYLNIS